MNKGFINYLHKSYFPIIFAISFIFLISTGVAFFSEKNKTIIFIVTLIILCVSVEIAFRLVWRLFFGEPYVQIQKIPFDDLSVEPHPYIPYVNKKNSNTPKATDATYPLHKGKYKFAQLRTNSLGFANGPKGNRDILVPKPEDLIRINCIGASTTMNYISCNEEDFSYPMELEKMLKSRLDVPLEVNNCGMGGYNSADIFVSFALSIIDTAPDFIILYHAYNDVRAYLTPGFSSDYSHCRQNLAANYWKYKIGAKIPQLKSKFLNYVVNRIFPINPRHSLLDSISKGTIDIQQDPSIGLRTYERNLQHIIDICSRNGIHVVLSTYAHFLYDAIKDEPLHQLYGCIVKQENEIMRGLAKKNDLLLVDNAALMPHDERFFVDSIHFTPEGMKRIALNFAEVLIPALESPKSRYRKTRYG